MEAALLVLILIPVFLIYVAVALVAHAQNGADEWSCRGNAGD